MEFNNKEKGVVCIKTPYDDVAQRKYFIMPEQLQYFNLPIWNSSRLKSIDF